jgi:hypothetical protein
VYAPVKPTEVGEGGGCHCVLATGLVKPYDEPAARYIRPPSRGLLDRLLLEASTVSQADMTRSGVRTSGGGGPEQWRPGPRAQ